jgi:hypothetical protein
MLDQSDPVVAVWDPNRKEPAGEGGTAQIAAEARQAGIPVVRIDPADPARATLAYTDEDGAERSDDLARLPDRLRRLLRPRPRRPQRGRRSAQARNRSAPGAGVRSKVA